MKYRIETMHDGYAIEATTASDDEIVDGSAFWSCVSGWETREEAENELCGLDDHEQGA